MGELQKEPSLLAKVREEAIADCKVQKVYVTLRLGKREVIKSLLHHFDSAVA